MDFSRSDVILTVCDEVETDDLTNDRDVYRQCCIIYVQANMAICKFNMCSVTVKTTLFKTYFTHMYAARLRRESSVICILSLICNLGMRLLLKVL